MLKLYYVQLFLGALAKVRKAAIKCFITVCPSSWNIAASPGRIFIKLDMITLFEKNPSIISKFHKNPTRITSTLHEEYSFDLISLIYS